MRPALSRGHAAALRGHAPLLAVLGLALALRVAAEVAFRPALFFGGDSSQYLKLALTGSPVGIAYERPSGYPLLIHAVFVLGRHMTVLTALQHAAGLGTGLLTYALARRMGWRRGWATAATALVVLDAYALALEQHVLAEAFFTPLLVGALLLALGRPRARSLAASGLLLGAAVTLRTEAIFALPGFLVFVAWRRPGWRPAAAALVACLVPLAVYASWHRAETGRLALTSAGGWYLYGRIGEIGGCGDADIPAAGRVLCRRVPRDDREGAAYHLWAPGGTAHRAFGSLTGSPARQRRINRILRDYALAIIRDRPERYAGMVAADVLRYFEPGVASRSVSDSAISFSAPATAMGLDPAVARGWFPDVRSSVAPPAGFVRHYARWVHTPRWLLGLLVLAGVLEVTLPRPRRREAFLLVGVPLAILVGATATSDFILRYLVPLTPALLVGGGSAAADLLSAALRHVRHRRGRVDGARSIEPHAVDPGTDVEGLYTGLPDRGGRPKHALGVLSRIARAALSAARPRAPVR
jgi:hypothetical protein